MKLELTQGCICDSFTADGKPLVDLDGIDLKVILVEAVNKIVIKKINEEDKSGLQRIIQDIVETFYDTYEASEPCECCGDYVETYTLTI